MDYAALITNVLSSGAVIYATREIVKGLKRRLTSLETIVTEQKNYIKEIRDEFSALNSIKSDFINEYSTLHGTYKEHVEKTYNDIIKVKDSEISFLKTKTITYEKTDTEIDFIKETPKTTNIKK